MRPAGVIAAVVVLAAAPEARAEERRATIGLVGGFALMDLAETDPLAEDQARADGYLGAALAYDTLPPAYPATPGYAVAGDIVPEVQLMAIGEGSLALGGVRLELDIAQKEQGLFKVSARSSVFVSAKVGAGDLADGIIAAFDVGSTIYVGDAWRFGYSFGALVWGEEELDGVYEQTETDAAMSIGIFVGSTI